MKKVTIVIPNYNGLKFMEPCMAALDKQLAVTLSCWWWTMAPPTAV